MKEKEERAVQILQMTYLMQKIFAQHRLKHEGKTKAVKGRDLMFLAGVNNLTSKGGAVKMSDIAEFFQITPAAVSQTIGRLEEVGYVERSMTKKDRRSVFVNITKEGKHALANDSNAKETKMQGLLRYLGEEDSEEMLRLLERVLAYFEEYETDES